MIAVLYAMMHVAAVFVAAGLWGAFIVFLIWAFRR